MKKTISIFMLAALLIGGLTGCYEDKGNYKYRDINEVTYKILPESEDGYYRFKQPPVDTMYVDYTVDLSQSQATNEENLEFLWLVSYSKDKKTVTDTITTRDLRLTFPPKKSSAFDIVFSLTDKQTNVSSYKELHIKTVYPYINSWLVLNGDKEDSRISAVEDPDSLNYFFTEDAYTALGYKKRFKDITELVYAPVITENGNAPEIPAPHGNIQRDNPDGRGRCDDRHQAAAQILLGQHDDGHIHEKEDNAADGGLPDQGTPENILPPCPPGQQQKEPRRAEAHCRSLPGERYAVHGRNADARFHGALARADPRGDERHI